MLTYECFCPRSAGRVSQAINGTLMVRAAGAGQLHFDVDGELDGALPHRTFNTGTVRAVVDASVDVDATP